MHYGSYRSQITLAPCGLNIDIYFLGEGGKVVRGEVRVILLDDLLDLSGSVRNVNILSLSAVRGSYAAAHGRSIGAGASVSAVFIAHSGENTKSEDYEKYDRTDAETAAVTVTATTSAVVIIIVIICRTAAPAVVAVPIGTSPVRTSKVGAVVIVVCIKSSRRDAKEHHRSHNNGKNYPELFLQLIFLR